MRIMLMWPSGAGEMSVILDALQKAGHEIVYWVGEHPAAHLAPKDCVFHDHYDAWDALPAEALKDVKIEPPDESLIASFYEAESLILSMMNKRYDRSPVDERKHIYYAMLAYWSYVLDRTSPEAIVFNDVPHSLYSNVVCELARQRGIKTLIFEGTLLCGRVISYEDMWEGSGELRTRLEANRKSGAVCSQLEPELQEYMRENWQRRLEVPAYMQTQRRLASGTGLLVHRVRIAVWSVLNGSIFRLAAGFLGRMFKRNLKSEYRALEVKPDLAAQFVYFPLSFQPERTTSPQGGIYNDQILAIETAAAALPQGWKLYVKEHPSQWWLRGKTRYSSARYEGYYRRIARIPNTVLVPPHVSSYELLTKAACVATITGTAGWESLLQGRTPLVFGYPWYRDCPGVLRVRSVEECRSAFERVTRGEAVRESDVCAFIKSVQDIGFPTNYALSTPRMSTEEELRAYATAIVQRLKSL